MGSLNRDFDLNEMVGGEGGSETTTVEFEKAIGCTEKALLVEVDGEEVFIPRREIHEVDEVNNQLEVSTWLCRKRGWE
jgi:hypothetical protein